MELKEILRILFEIFGKHIQARDPESIGFTNLQKLQGVFHLFYDRSDSFLLYNNQKDFASKVWSGNSKLSKENARILLTKINDQIFEDFVFDEFDYDDDSVLERLFDSFYEFGYSLDSDNYTQKIPDIMRDILDRIVNAPVARSIKNCEFVEGYVILGRKKFKLHPKLVPPVTTKDTEEVYIQELLKAYSQDANIEFNSISDLEEAPGVYKEHIDNQRVYFFSAQTVKYQVRDSNLFTDGTYEFDLLETEVHDSIKDRLLLPRRNGFERINNVMDFISTVNLSKSYFSQPGNSLVGIPEKKGIIHILVNDRKVIWISKHDTDL